MKNYTKGFCDLTPKKNYFINSQLSSIPSPMGEGIELSFGSGNEYMWG
jgi:hypothetical protein